jgi:hypothetical protein
MVINPKEYFKTLSHIKSDWPKGCHCMICRGVDFREQVRYVRKEEFGRKEKEGSKEA